MSCSSKCDACPVPPDRTCIMCERGRCELIEQESVRLANDPNFDAPWHRFAMENAGVPVPEAKVILGTSNDPTGDGPQLIADPELPPLWKMALGFIRDVGRHVVNGMPKRSPEEYDRIMAICRTCDHMRSDGRCGKQTGCGCNMELKASMALTRCPENKW